MADTDVVDNAPSVEVPEESVSNDAPKSSQAAAKVSLL